MVEYKIIKRTNKDYDRLSIQKADLLYEGGTEIAKCASLFLGKQEDESDEFYEERLRTAYDPIYANTLDRIKALLFSEPLTITPSVVTNDPSTPSKPVSKDLKEFLHKFETNCDRKGTSLHNFVKQSLLCALKHSRAFTMVEFPRIDPALKKTNYADQLAAGELNGYLVDIPLDTIVDWQYNEQCELVWVKLAVELERRASPLSPLMRLYRWIMIELKDGFVVYTINEKEINLDENEKLEDETDIPEVGVITTSFKTINIIELNLAPGLALGKLIGPHCEQLYRTDSVINATVQRNAIVLPILKAGNNLNQPTADGRRSINTVQMDPNRFMSPFAAQRQKGWLLIGKDDSAEILEVEGKAVAMLQEQKKLIIERINTAVHQLSQNIQSHGKEAASAAAKQEDRRDTEIILNEYKTEVEIFVLKIIKLILELRAEGDVSLHMQGLNTEDDEDKKEVIAELVAYGSFPNSEVFRVNFEYDRAEALCDSLSQDDKVKMREQIEKSVKVKMDQDIKMKQQQLKAGEPDGDERQPAPQGKS